MTATQKASDTKSVKANVKASSGKAPAKRTTKNAKAPVLPPAAESQQLTPAIIPTSEGAIALAGPLARKEIASHLAEVAEEMGVPTVTTDDGVVMAPEQREGERRNGDRRHADALAQFVNQQMQPAAAPITTEQAPSEAAQAEAETNQQVARDAVAATNPPQANPPAAIPPGFAEALAALQQQFGIQVAPVIPSGITAGRPGRDTKNNITRPGPGTKTGFIWDKADEITAANKGSPASIEQLKLHPEVKHFNDHTIRTQYARWRQYNGVVGRVATPQQFKPAAPVSAPQAAPASALQAPQAVQAAPQAPASVDLSRVEAMSDQVYQNLLNMKRNNTLPESMIQLLNMETARRDAEGAENNHP